jgi:hypothetical protein
MQVFDSDLGIFTADGCHGGGSGYNRALCIEQNVEAIECSWYGRAKSCSQTCPPSQISISQNTHIGYEAAGCDHNRYSSFCCKEIYSWAISTCPATNLANSLSGGLAPRVADTSKISGSTLGIDLELGTQFECAAAVLSGGEAASVAAIVGTTVAGLYIYNKLPGYWILSAAGAYIWMPIRNALYPSVTQAPNIACTTTVTETLTTTTITATSTRTCDGNQWPQACQHYSSVIRDRKAFPISILSCPINPGEANRVLPETWNKQHAQTWLSWVPPFTKFKQPGKPEVCQRDEYPPIAFAPAGGWIRYLPAGQNQGAGTLWSGICKSNPANNLGPVQGGPTAFSTCTSQRYLTYSLNAFSMAFKNMPAQADDGIPSNQCLPSITADAGFALFTDDAWYGAAPHINPKKTDYASKIIPAALLVNAGAIPRPAGPYKRDVDLAGHARHDDLFEDPDRIFVDDGNSTRKALDEELWEHLGLKRCQDKACSNEKEMLNIEEAESEELKEIPITAALGPSPTSTLPEASSPPMTGGSPWTGITQATQTPESELKKRKHLHRHRHNHHHGGNS